jgi:hypothetical protein
MVVAKAAAMEVAEMAVAKEEVAMEVTPAAEMVAAM